MRCAPRTIVSGEHGRSLGNSQRDVLTDGSADRAYADDYLRTAHSTCESTLDKESIARTPRRCL
jgi:hypothetical protein